MKCDDDLLSANLKQDWSGELDSCLPGVGMLVWWSGDWRSGSGDWDWDAGEMNWQRQRLLSSPVGEGCVHQYVIYVVVRNNNNFFL